MADRIIAAAKDGNIDILREATRKDLNSPDEDGMSATMWAAHNGNLEALRLIVGREGEVNKCDYLGLTALHHAAMRGHLDVVSYLVHWGCNVYSLDNDMHSAQDLASINDYHDIIRFLDKVLDQKRYKNPKSVARQKEEAIRAAENNQKKYEKLQEAAEKRAEKEKKRLEKEMNKTMNGHPPKKNIFQTLTVRIKKNSGTSRGSKSSLTNGQSNFSHMAGLTYSRTAKGASNKYLNSRSSMDGHVLMSTSSEVKNGTVNSNEKSRYLRNSSMDNGFQGTVSGVTYKNASMTSSQDALDKIDNTRPLASDVFRNKTNSNGRIYRAKSESDLLDSGVDSYYGEEDEEEYTPSSLFNHTEFGKLSFLPKNPMISTLQSFSNDNTGSLHSAYDPAITPSDNEHPNENTDSRDGVLSQPERGYISQSSSKLPWNLDDVDALDENDEFEVNKSKMSSLEVFLVANGLINYLHVFAQEEVDLQLLMRMNDGELKDLGLPLGPRKKLGEAILRRKQVLERPSVMVDTYL